MEGKLAPLMSSERTDWRTPDYVFDPLHAVFGFTLDAAADASSARCARWLGPDSPIAEDGLSVPWGPGESVFVNPPYGQQLSPWLAKAHAEGRAGNRVVCLVTAKPDTQYWFQHARHGLVWFVRGRIRFERPGVEPRPAPFPSAVVIFGDGITPAVSYWDPRCEPPPWPGPVATSTRPARVVYWTPQYRTDV